MTPNWRQLQSLSSSKPVQSSAFWVAFVPVSARLLQGVESVVNIELFAQHFTLHLALPFSWKILFFAACAFMLANLVVAIWCPQIVKQTKNYSDFIDQKRSASELADLSRAVQKLRLMEEDKLPVMQNGLNRYQQFMVQPSKDINAHGLSQEQAERGMADTYFLLVEATVMTNLWSRRIATFFYGLGFLGVTLVFAQSTKFVIAQL